VRSADVQAGLVDSHSGGAVCRGGAFLGLDRLSTIGVWFCAILKDWRGRVLWG